MNFNISSNFSKDGKIVKMCLCALYFLYSPSSSYIPNMTTVCVVPALFSVAAIILNYMYIFWISPRMRSKISSFTIKVLSSIDLSVSTIVQLLFLLQLLNSTLRTTNCIYVVSTYLATFLSPHYWWHLRLWIRSLGCSQFSIALFLVCNTSLFVHFSIFLFARKRFA